MDSGSNSGFAFNYLYNFALKPGNLIFFLFRIGIIYLIKLGKIVEVYIYSFIYLLSIIGYVLFSSERVRVPSMIQLKTQGNNKQLNKEIYEILWGVR